MATKITIAKVCTWMKSTFGEDCLLLPDHMPPKWRDLNTLDLHRKVAQFRLEGHASKAIMIGQESPSKITKESAFTWAVLNTDRQDLAFYQLSKNGSSVRKVKDHELQNIKPVALFKRDIAAAKAMLFYFFLDCGAVEELNAYGEFFHDLERTFRHHINKEKGKAKRMRGEESSGHDIKEPLAKKRELEHNCHAIHEQLAKEYAKNLIKCNQLRQDKEALDASVARLQQNTSDAQKWKAECDRLAGELQLEKDKGKNFARKLVSEDESEATAVEKQAQELMAYAAMKRAKHAMK